MAWSPKDQPIFFETPCNHATLFSQIYMANCTNKRIERFLPVGGTMQQQWIHLSKHGRIYRNIPVLRFLDLEFLKKIHMSSSLNSPNTKLNFLINRLRVQLIVQTLSRSFDILRKTRYNYDGVMEVRILRAIRHTLIEE
ncbi:uncharacterized protein LOC100577396 [Apis mellifera]|uniref:Uncharacterized protein LOC100577396 n=1 Tax=Apis mellifera TaxID=7460 RepID=A0A7M7L568_APIME|nr:uncharacterized protein LOC100577396 [Apis mellifera]XP_026296693.1 uncharacterized protein LOC100577396 [Apis mellifera]|eukprot:XP_026296692.1 uncharacterized protein LOC100577396 [Apis mellifera]